MLFIPRHYWHFIVSLDPVNGFKEWKKRIKIEDAALKNKDDELETDYHTSNVVTPHCLSISFWWGARIEQTYSSIE